MRSLCIIFLMFSFSVSGQTGIIIDAESRNPIAGVAILSLADSSGFLSDENGKFTFVYGNEYSFQMLGYLNSQLKTENKNLTVALIPDPLILSTVTVQSQSSPATYGSYPGSVSMITSKDMEQSDQTIITEQMNKLPGVYMQSGALNTNRITIRGIGARSPFSTNKIRAYYEDIPLTDGIGETTIEDIDVNAIGSVEIIKGPNSSIYGSGLGGSIQIKHRKAMFNEKYLFNNLSIGTYSTIQSSSGFASNKANNSTYLAYNRLSSDGYRMNNDFKRKSILAATSFYRENDRIDFISYFINQNAQIPSSIDYKTYHESPKSAAFTWNSSKGFEDYDKFLIGLSWGHQFNKSFSTRTSLFSNYRNAYEARPFNILNEEVTGVGIRSKIIKELDRFSTLIMGGFELYYDHYGWSTYENLYLMSPGSGSVKGVELSDNMENRNYFNVFGDIKFNISKELTGELGLNVNQTQYKLNDQFNADSIDQSGNYKFSPIISPKFSIGFDIIPTLFSFITISHGFSPPSLEETLTPEGLLNPEIKPETGWNYEFGIKGHSSNNNIAYDCSIYSMRINNLLVARRTGLDQYVGINAGSTVHNGFESEVRASMINRKFVKIQSTLSVTISNYKFRKFIDDDTDYSGNELTGVPKDQINFEINGFFWNALYTNINAYHFGKMPMNDSNSIYSSSYKLLNILIGVKRRIFEDLYFDISFRLNNLLNEKYASMISINAIGFGSSSPRYYYPGLPTTYNASLKLKYLF